MHIIPQEESGASFAEVAWGDSERKGNISSLRTMWKCGRVLVLSQSGTTSRRTTHGAIFSQNCEKESQIGQGRQVENSIIAGFEIKLLQSGSGQEDKCGPSGCGDGENYRLLQSVHDNIRAEAAHLCGDQVCHFLARRARWLKIGHEWKNKVDNEKASSLWMVFHPQPESNDIQQLPNDDVIKCILGISFK